MSQVQASAPFPEIELDASAPAPSYHKIVFTINVRQDGQPWHDLVDTDHHASNAVVSLVVGRIAGFASKLGPKGNKPKNQEFDLDLKLEVDGQSVLNPSPASWNGVSREFILAAEHELVAMWADMNADSVKTNKAHGKI